MSITVIARALVLGLVLALPALAPTSAEEDTPAPPYRPDGVLYSGFASVPWHATFSPDGRLVAVVEGHSPRFVQLIDARTRRVLTRFETKTQPAARRPVFVLDGESLVLVEDAELVVRTRTAGWKASVRLPLPARPGVSLNPRSLVGSPSGRHVALVIQGRAHIADLVERRVVTLRHTDVHSVRYVGARLAVTRWSDEEVETVLTAHGERPETTLEFGILAASRDGRAWFVARQPRAPFHLVDAATKRNLAEVSLTEAAPRSAEFSPDGAHLVVIEDLETATVRDARTGRLLQRLDVYSGDRFIGIAFDHDGKRLVTAGRRADELDASVLLWRRR